MVSTMLHFLDPEFEYQCIPYLLNIYFPYLNFSQVIFRTGYAKSEQTLISLIVIQGSKKANQKISKYASGFSSCVQLV